MRKTISTCVQTLAALSIIGAMAMGCAVSDYAGYIGHATDNEAKMAGVEYSFSGFGDLDGTYAYTVKYNWQDRQNLSDIQIRTYRNAVPGAFSNDSAVAVDGDFLRRSAGDLSSNHSPADPAGQFNREWRYVDSAPGCQFGDNFVADRNSSSSDSSSSDGGNAEPDVLPFINLCYSAPVQEIDGKNRSLQDNFRDIDELVNRVWNARRGENVLLTVNSIELNGNLVELPAGFEIHTVAQGYGPAMFMSDMSTEGGRQLLEAILNNTGHLELTTIALNFGGGMRIKAPSNMQVAFNHDVGWNVLNPPAEEPPPAQ